MLFRLYRHSLRYIAPSITPVPFYSLEVDEKKGVIRLIVQEGIHKPYFETKWIVVQCDEDGIVPGDVEIPTDNEIYAQISFQGQFFCGVIVK